MKLLTGLKWSYDRLLLYAINVCTSQANKKLKGITVKRAVTTPNAATNLFSICCATNEKQTNAYCYYSESFQEL